MFNKALEAMKEYDEIYRAANEVYTKTRKEISANFKGDFAVKKLGEAKAVFENTVFEEKKRCKTVAEEDFTKLQERINAVVTAAVPADFMVTLEAVKASGTSVTDFEANSFIEKYKHNYLALKAITEVLQQAGKANDVYIVKADSIINGMNQVKGLVDEFFRNYAVGSYMVALMTNHTNPLTQFAERAVSFLNAEFILSESV